MSKSKVISAMLPRSWKKSFNNDVIIPVKVRGCDECRGKIFCMTCNNQVNGNKDFEAYLILLKRQAPNRFGNVLPHYKE